MTSNAKWGANSPLSSESEEPDIVFGSDNPFGSQDDAAERKQSAPREHDPDAKALLNRHLTALQNGKQKLGNSALHDLESKLAALCEKDRAETSAFAASEPATDGPELPDFEQTSLKDRLFELSQYLDEDLTRLETGRAQLVEPEPEPEPSAPRSERIAPKTAIGKDDASGARHTHKPLSAPILDRAWFENRFAAMRSSIDEIAQQVPDKRVEKLGDQFNQLMEKLDAIQADRSRKAVESGLKQLANYLEENRNWTVSHDNRIKDLEERLDHLSRLVSQSNAALSSAVKGLEIVARGTGPALANKTADLVAERLEPRLSKLATGEKVSHLSGEVNKMMLQSQQFARKTDDRLKLLQTSLDDGLHKMEEIGETTDDIKVAEGWNGEIDADTYQPPCSGKLSAAQRAAQFASEHDRELPEDGEPIRHQIPYGEFLPEDERNNSHMGLVIAAIILLLASAAMLYLNLKDSGATRLLSNKQKAANLIIPVAARAEQPVRIVLTKADPVPTAANAAPSLTMHHAAPNADTLSPAVAKQDQDGNERQAAILGDTAAQYSIAESYLLEIRNETREAAAKRLSQAARWFRRAAESGHVTAQYRLATLYELGQGVPQNYSEALKWYEKAAAGGHIKAMHNLGVLTASTTVGKPNFRKAAYWFAKAAEHGLRDSQYNLAILNENGLGVKKNLRSALRWYSAAALQGDMKAAEKWNELLQAHPGRGPVNAIITPQDIEWTAVTTGNVNDSNKGRKPGKASPLPNAVWKKPAPKVDRNVGGWSAQLTYVKDTVLKAQELLHRLGFRPGKTDGILGPRTMAAIRAYQKKAGIPQTGSLSDALMSRMEAELAS